ncbi:MAG: RNA polymerase sigma factor [Candidatus Aminicenantes bacterium]|nr:RNA polymerase sigma factor [Candidatus Aminicenantes bacterium]
MDEIALVQSAQEGNTEAFKHLFEEHKRRVLGLAYQYTKNIEDAEDILQDTFIKAFHSLRKFDIQDYANFSSWLYRIGINCSIDHLRKRKRQKNNILPGGDVMDLSASDHHSNPDDAQHKREIRERLEQVLGTLTRRQRMIFILKHHQELSIKEIAEYMNCSEGSVKKQLFRTVSVMKKHFRHYLPEAGYEMQKI